VVDGRAGVGKTRLIDEFCRAAFSTGCVSVRLSLRERQTPSDLLRGLASGPFGDPLRHTDRSKIEVFLKKMFATGSSGVAEATIALATTGGLAPTGAVDLGVWLGAGKVALPLLTAALRHLCHSEAEGTLAPREGLAELLDALQGINEHLCSGDQGQALVIVFDEWDRVKSWAPDQRDAAESIAAALHERIRRWDQRRALTLIGVRTEDRADTIAEVANSANTRSLVVRPLGFAECRQLLMTPTGQSGYFGAFADGAANECYQQCQGNAEILVFLASGMWETARERGRGTITAEFYREHAPARVEELVSTRVERFLRVHHENESAAKGVLHALAEKEPDYHWTAQELIRRVNEKLEPDHVRGILRDLSRPDFGLLVYHPGDLSRQAYYQFRHDLRWHGLRQWAYPEETADRRDTWLAVAGLRRLITANRRRLPRSLRAFLYYHLGVIDTEEATNLLDEMLLEEDSDLQGFIRQVAKGVW